MLRRMVVYVESRTIIIFPLTQTRERRATTAPKGSRRTNQGHWGGQTGGQTEETGGNRGKQGETGGQTEETIQFNSIQKNFIWI